MYRSMCDDLFARFFWKFQEFPKNIISFRGFSAGGGGGGVFQDSWNFRSLYTVIRTAEFTHNLEYKKSYLVPVQALLAYNRCINAVLAFPETYATGWGVLTINYHLISSFTKLKNCYSRVACGALYISFVINSDINGLYQRISLHRIGYRLVIRLHSCIISNFINIPKSWMLLQMPDSICETNLRPALIHFLTIQGRDVF